jgi:hypothetical protein
MLERLVFSVLLLSIFSAGAVDVHKEAKFAIYYNEAGDVLQQEMLDKSIIQNRTITVFEPRPLIKIRPTYGGELIGGCPGSCWPCLAPGGKMGCCGICMDDMCKP